MITKYLLTAVVLFFTTCIEAQDEFLIQKKGNDTILVNNIPVVTLDTIILSDSSLLKDYGVQNIIKAAIGGTCSVTPAKRVIYSLIGLKRKEQSTPVVLMKQNRTITKKILPPTMDEWQFAWETMLLWIGSGIVGFILTSIYIKNEALDNLVSIVIACIIGCIVGFIARYSVESNNDTLLLGLFIAFIIAGTIGGVTTIFTELTLIGAAYGLTIGWFVGIGIGTNQWIPLVICILLNSFGIFLNQKRKKIQA